MGDRSHRGRARLQPLERSTAGGGQPHQLPLARPPAAYWAYGTEDILLVEPNTQGAAIAAAWAEYAGPNSSWLDLIDGQAHNITHTTINQREIERFVDLAVAPS